MAVLPGTNASSLTERSLNLIFPALDDIRTKIPLWMKFYCYEYSSSAFGRAATLTNAQGGGGFDTIPGLRTFQKAAIFLPAPTSFETSNNHRYQADKTSSMNLFSSVLGDAISDAAETALGVNLQSAANEITQIVNGLELAFSNATGLASEIELDQNDNQYKSAGPSRSFEMRFQLPCITVEDSMIAAKIIRAFEALSLPTARSIFSLTSTKSYHPPVWVFGIGPIDQRKYDQDWTGQPQLSVLRGVKFRQTAFDTNSLAAIGYPGKQLLKPIAYTLTLSFAELEPAFRSTELNGETGIKIANRSTIMVTTGINNSNPPTATP